MNLTLVPLLYIGINIDTLEKDNKYHIAADMPGYDKVHHCCMCAEYTAFPVKLTAVWVVIIPCSQFYSLLSCMCPQSSRVRRKPPTTGKHWHACHRDWLP